MTNKLKENVINILNDNVEDNIKVLMLSGIIEDVKNSSNNDSGYNTYTCINAVLIEIIGQNNLNVFKGLFDLYFSSENENNIAIEGRDLTSFLIISLMNNCDLELVNFILHSVEKYHDNISLESLIINLKTLLLIRDEKYKKDETGELRHNIIKTYFNIVDKYNLPLTEIINFIINYNFEESYFSSIFKYLFETLNEEQIKSINFEGLLSSRRTCSLENNCIEWIAKLYFKSLKKSEKVNFIIFKLKEKYYNYQLKIFYNILNEEEKKEFAKTLKDNLKGENAEKIIDLLSYLDKETVLEIFDNNPEEIKKIKDKDGYNLLDYLCANLIYNNNFELFEYLLENNIDINEGKKIPIAGNIYSPALEFFATILSGIDSDDIELFKYMVRSFVKSIANVNSKDNNIQLLNATEILNNLNFFIRRSLGFVSSQAEHCLNQTKINAIIDALNSINDEYNIESKVYGVINLNKDYSVKNLENVYNALIDDINTCVSDVSDEIKRSSSSSFNSSEIDNSNSNQLDDNSTENSDNLTTISNSEINDNQEEVRRRESTSSFISQESDIEGENQLFQDNEINNNSNDEENSTDSRDVASNEEENSTDSRDVASDEAENSESGQIAYVEQNNGENESFLGRLFNPFSRFFAKNSESEQIDYVEQNNSENESFSDRYIFKPFLRTFVGAHLPEYSENDEEDLNPEQENEASEINNAEVIVNQEEDDEENLNPEQESEVPEINNAEVIVNQEEDDEENLNPEQESEVPEINNAEVLFRTLPRSISCPSLNLLQNKGSSRNKRNNFSDEFDINDLKEYQSNRYSDDKSDEDSEINYKFKYINKTKERDQINIQKEIINKYKEKMNKSNHYLNSNFKRKKEDIENIKNLTSSIKEYLSQNIENHNFKDKKYKDKYNKICNTFDGATLSKIKIGFKTMVNNGFGGEISYDKLTKRINNIKFSKDSFIIRELSKPEYDNYKDLRNMLINGIRFDYADKNNLDSEFFIDIIEQFKTKPIYAFDRLFKNDKIIMVANVSGDVICGGIQDKLSSFFSLATKKRRQVNKINRLKKEILEKLKNRRDKKIIENISNIFIRASVDDSYREKVVSEDLIFKNTNTLGEWIIRLFKNINETGNLNIDENTRNSLLSFRNSNKILGFKKYVNDSFNKNLELINNEISLSSISSLVI